MNIFPYLYIELFFKWLLSMYGQGHPPLLINEWTILQTINITFFELCFTIIYEEQSVCVWGLIWQQDRRIFSVYVTDTMTVTWCIPLMATPTPCPPRPRRASQRPPCLRNHQPTAPPRPPPPSHPTPLPSLGPSTSWTQVRSLRCSVNLLMLLHVSKAQNSP